MLPDIELTMMSENELIFIFNIWLVRGYVFD